MSVCQMMCWSYSISSVVHNSIFHSKFIIVWFQNKTASKEQHTPSCTHKSLHADAKKRSTHHLSSWPDMSFSCFAHRYTWIKYTHRHNDYWPMKRVVACGSWACQRAGCSWQTSPSSPPVAWYQLGETDVCLCPEKERQRDSERGT